MVRSKAADHDNQGGKNSAGKHTQKKLRFSLQTTSHSELSVGEANREERPRGRSGVAPVDMSRTEERPRGERGPGERAKDLEERLLLLWYRGMPRPPQSRIKDFQSRKPPFDDDCASVATELHDYDPAVHNPVFYGKMYKTVDVDLDLMESYDPSQSHPSCVGYAFIDKPPKTPPPPPTPLPPKDKCSPRVYLENYIFPTLLPALEEMLRAAKKERCFERKRTKFNSMDFLTEYLYNNNPNKSERDQKTLGEIPFVSEHWKEHPRPPLPKSLLWTEEEATLIVQSHWRGYKVRLEPEVQELRQWQREWREENENIHNKVDDFWAKKMPEGENSAQNESEEQPNSEEKLETEEKTPSPQTKTPPVKTPSDTQQNTQLVTS